MPVNRYHITFEFEVTIPANRLRDLADFGEDPETRFLEELEEYLTIRDFEKVVESYLQDYVAYDIKVGGGGVKKIKKM
jgi:hypothetical protein